MIYLDKNTDPLGKSAAKYIRNSLLFLSLKTTYPRADLPSVTSFYSSTNARSWSVHTRLVLRSFIVIGKRPGWLEYIIE